MTPEARGQWEANSGRHELLPPRLLRRRFLTAISLAGISTVGLAELGAQSPARPSPAPSTTKSNGLLVRPQGVRQLETRSKIVLELEGQLQIKEPDPNKDAKSRTAEVKGKSTLDYFERIALDDASYPLAAARSYVEAGVENWISGS
ncbi:MAG: hypothetical protein KDA61_22665, partial [Planctomycetales bacterium]|nr:hypothetical protein [Planctomycetales bacterium]